MSVGGERPKLRELLKPDGEELILPLCFTALMQQRTTGSLLSARSLPHKLEFHRIVANEPPLLLENVRASAYAGARVHILGALTL